MKAILNLDEIGGIMFIKYVLLAKWTDPGLTFHNLKRDENRNLLTESEWSRIWVPKVIFDNTEAEEKSIMDTDAIIRVLPNENFTHVSSPKLCELNPSHVTAYLRIKKRTTRSR